mmetsp:Transcript_114115/g.355356  ORF Transcript_114115/g.355356 Transcript_114115/m.355356 type:complete len:168 (+) Transcript_114115:85-588(+)|eukprot:CAMPEP_0204530434 /NCGR_PEP_ID=MMETSP0661-20131031/10621_1 /ASSEMBLY_ACC=CAM_ASM_000606 /TAXON_ID=109239 /ORGANISM="Alexandrium margalefi, Strain AMGDE01CS-322" /LENGTH=167 /DNA_ID=CAMNT_0051536529 /DNA_START=85 /DNA_END=588 /DNA_ORIENTATION=+
MGCIQASSVRTDIDRGGGAEGPGREDEAEEVDAFGDSLPQARNLPRLLDSAAFQRTDELETTSVASSRPTSITAIPTPSIVLSNYDSVAVSSNRAEVDKESVYDVGRSVGVPSVCTFGAGGSQDELGSNWGGEVYDTQKYLQELELAMGMTDNVPALVPEAETYRRM